LKGGRKKTGDRVGSLKRKVGGWRKKRKTVSWNISKIEFRGSGGKEFFINLTKKI